MSCCNKCDGFPDEGHCNNYGCPCHTRSEQEKLDWYEKKGMEWVEKESRSFKYPDTYTLSTETPAEARECNCHFFEERDGAAKWGCPVHGYKVKPRTPHPEQEESVEKLLEEFRKHTPSTLVTGGDAYEAGKLNETLDKWWAVIWKMNEDWLREKLNALLTRERESALKQAEEVVLGMKKQILAEKFSVPPFPGNEEYERGINVAKEEDAKTLTDAAAAIRKLGEE